jgi:hypothetical protein
MISGNGVPAASDRDKGARVRDDRQLRDIQDLIARLESVNKQLSLPVLAMRTPRPRTQAPGDTPAAEGSGAPGTLDTD